MMTHEDLYDDLPLLALGSLDADELRALEQHLAGGCARCQDELNAWRAVVALLPLGAEDVEMPNLKPRLLQRLRPPVRVAKVIPLRRRWALPLAAAAVLLLAIGAVRDLRLQQTVHQQGEELAGVRAQLQVTETDFQRLAASFTEKETNAAELRAALAAAQETLGMLQRPGLQLVRLKQTPEAQPAEAHALLSPDVQRALFYAFDLPPVAAGKAYELWWITEKEGPVRAGVFLPDENRIARLASALPADAGAIQAAAVTIEPAAGVPKPTGPMVLLGKL